MSSWRKLVDTANLSSTDSSAGSVARIRLFDRALTAAEVTALDLTRRSFFTAVNLFGIAFTLMVLVVVTALADEFLGNQDPQGNADRMLGVYRVVLKGPHRISIGPPGFALLEQTLYD